MKTNAFVRAVCAVTVMVLCGGAASNDLPPPWAFIVMHKGPDLPKDKPVTVAGSKLGVPLKEFEKIATSPIGFRISTPKCRWWSNAGDRKRKCRLAPNAIW